MNNSLDNMDDLLDNNIGKSLRELGFTFPRTAEDFKRIEECVKKKKVAVPARLQDPYTFLGERAFNLISQNVHDQGQGEYFQQLAQAARDGKIITDDLKKKMAEDKLKSGKKKTEE